VVVGVGKRERDIGGIMSVGGKPKIVRRNLAL
jgi:hypothetical protein